MRTLILLSLLSVVFVFSQRPVLSENFSALVDALIDGRVVERVQAWVDYDDQKTRFDFARDHVQIHRYNFYKLLKSYDVDERTQNCTVTPLTTTLKPTFGWVINATGDKTCFSNIERGAQGDLWSYTSSITESLYLCVDSTDVNRPFWVERVSAREHDYFQFHAYIPGIPKPEIFVLPPFCSK
eukprot:TRINITY_DN1440_c0_g1_i2.p1 TRINITY_DN1440_c0_g1~~TRINITY_DN1440_c0_g1_i2.p1  ORF type:complete len:183 (-),score=30.78 TRINITY_DN1440_c0_g1_i2:18-566(-)